MLVILCGKSASGKDTLRDCLEKEYGYTRLVSCTTRPKREGEMEGREYHFLSEEEFDKREMIEKREYNAFHDGVPVLWKYGTEAVELDRHREYIAIKDPEGARLLKAHYGEKDCAVIYLDCPEGIRTERAEKRGSFDRTEWERRLISDRKDFEKVSDIADCTIINDGSIPMQKIAEEIYYGRCFVWTIAPCQQDDLIKE